MMAGCVAGVRSWGGPDDAGGRSRGREHFAGLVSQFPGEEGVWAHG
jgi:hypothetical protein